MTTTEAQALVATYRDAERTLERWAHTHDVIDFLDHPKYQQLLTARDNARDALVAALVGGGS